jgi:hypothetical protein
VNLIHFLLISIESEIFQQTDQMLSQSDSDSIKNHFFRKTKIFLIYNKSETITNAPTRAEGETEAKYLSGLALALQGSDKP